MIPLAAAGAFLRAVPRQVWYVLALLVALWIGYAWAFHRGAASRDDEVSKWRTAAQAGVDANTSNQNTIRELREANAAWAATCTLDTNASGEAAETVEANRDALPRDDQRRQQEREKTYDRDPSAAEWGRTVVPAAVADRLRR